MELVNLMETVVEEVLDLLLRGRKDVCGCPRCRLDMKAYALNRLPPQYVVSERGLTHSVLDTVRQAQHKADAIRTVAEAILTVGRRPRTGHRRSHGPGKAKATSGIRILGSVYWDERLEPASGAKIRLVDRNGREVPMRGRGWENPMVLGEHTLGIFSFWPATVPSRRSGWRIEVVHGKTKRSVPVNVPEGGAVRSYIHLQPIFLRQM